MGRKGCPKIFAGWIQLAIYKAIFKLKKGSISLTDWTTDYQEWMAFWDNNHLSAFRQGGTHAQVQKLTHEKWSNSIVQECSLHRLIKSFWGPTTLTEPWVFLPILEWNLGTCCFKAALWVIQRDHTTRNAMPMPSLVIICADFSESMHFGFWWQIDCSIQLNKHFTKCVKWLQRACNDGHNSLDVTTHANFRS